jgi:adenylate cyclase
VTPLGTAVPGVEIHAQALEQMILGQHLLRPDWATGLEAVLFLALGGVLVLLLPRTGAVAASAIGLAAAGAAVGGSWWAFAEHRFLLDPVYPALGALAVYVPTVATLYAMTEREKRVVRRAFSQYLSPALVARLAERPQELRLAGEDRALTLMFCDIRGFTGLSEAMSAEALTRFMNRYLTAMSAPVLESGGTIDKYIGDAIMAFWNAPLDDPEHPAHACDAALGMRAALAALNARLAAEPDAPPLPRSGVAIGTGLHSGHCRVGNMGSETRFAYTVIGDAVNLAARIEGECKTYGVDILLSDATREGAGPGFRTLEADVIRVRGRRAPVRVHALVGRVPEAGAAEDGFDSFAARHGAMLAAWRGRDREGTRAAAEALAAEIAAHPAWLPQGCRLAGLYALYRSRAERCAADPPPPDRDGATGGEG